MDVGAHCYRISLMRTLFIRHARTRSYKELKNRVKNATKHRADGLCVTFVLTRTFFAGCSVIPIFLTDHFLFWFFRIYLSNKVKKKKKTARGSFNYFAFTIYIDIGRNFHITTGVCNLDVAFLRLILPELVTYVEKNLLNRPINAQINRYVLDIVLDST